MISDTIKNYLKSEYDAGATYQQIAKRHDMSYAYIRSLILGKNPITKISLGKLDKMFPNARIDLDGSGASSPYQSGSPGAILLNGNHNIAGDGEALRAKIVLSILDLDLPPEVQSQVLKVIKNA